MENHDAIKEFLKIDKIIKKLRKIGYNIHCIDNDKIVL